jgi:hypothetical protein
MFTAAVVDDFNRADGALGANWGTLNFEGTPLQVISNACGAAAGGSYWTTPFGPDQECYAEYRAGSGVWVLARVSNPTVGASTTGYLIYWSSSTMNLYRIDPGPRFVLLGSRAASLAAGDLLGIGTYGSSIEAWHKPTAGAAVQDVVVTDATYASGGCVGLVHDSTTTRVDNFAAGSIVAAAAPPPLLRRHSRGLILR